MSSWDNFPTDENPHALYKFFSMQLGLSKNVNHINRQTYSILDWLGDIGGLFEAMAAFGEIAAAPCAAHAINRLLAGNIVRHKPTQNVRKHRAETPH